MTTIERYLIVQIIWGLLIATAILIPLFSFLDLVEQLDDVGEGFYTVEDAFFYVLLLLPRRFVQLIPFIALLGNVAALGRLAINLELITLRAAGMSPVQISLASLKVGVILIVIMVVLEQFIAPEFQHKAIAHRSEALAQSTELGQDLGVWTRDDSNILRIADSDEPGIMRGVEILNLNNDEQLEEYIHADYANIVDENHWVLHKVNFKVFSDAGIKSGSIDSLLWEPFLKPDQISALSRPPESLSPTDLYKYIDYLRDTGQEFGAYSLALWRKAGGGIITLAMLLVSVPFVFGSVRTGIAYRLVLAGITGICVYLFDQVVSNVGLILDLSYPLVALSPGILLAGLAVFWLKRFT